MSARDFDAEYYQHHCGRPYQRDAFWVGFFGRIADLIVSEIRPRRVLDAGCAMGILVDALRERGVEAYGFDISSFALSQVSPAVRAYCWQASLTDEIAERYDLIVCQEVFAHLAGAEAERAIANLCRHSDDVFFSASPFGPAPLHANVEPPEHWAGVFARHGFYRDFAFDGRAMAPAAVRYRRGLHAPEALVVQYERLLLPLLRERDEHRAHRQLAEETVRNMERSWFWKARSLWMKARAPFSLSRRHHPPSA